MTSRRKAKKPETGMDTTGDEDKTSVERVTSLANALMAEAVYDIYEVGAFIQALSVRDSLS